MKNIFYSLLLFSFAAFSQSPDKNYIKTIYYKKPFTTSSTNPSPSDAFTNVSYMDGFGKKVQEVQSQTSGTGKDVIFNYEYDVNGEIKKTYLPFTIGTSTMYYDDNAPINASSFSLYTGQTPYTEVVYEKSPLNNILQVASAGNDWDLPISPTDEDHTKKYEYTYNTSVDNVILYTAKANWIASKGLFDSTLLNSSGTVIYNDHELIKSITKNENWVATDGNDNTVQSFTDKRGNLILKRTFENNVSHDTYYVYDQFNNLAYVIPPGVTNISNQLNGMCYQYKYDDRNRLVEKKLPGKQWQYIVYDKRNRIVASGPTYSPFNDSPAGAIGWLITKYDAFDRVIYTGWQSATINTTTRKSLQDAQNALATTVNETKTASGTIDGITVYYSNTVSPTSFKLLTVNYYDNYSFPNAPTFKTTVEGQTVLAAPKGSPTGNWSRLLTSLASITGEINATYYDLKGRGIRTYNKNYLGGYTERESKLDFAGVTQYEVTYHKRTTGVSEIKTIDSFTYTPQGRLDTHSHQIGTNPAELMSKNYYNEIGQLITKKVGNTDLSGNTSFQKVDYNYNIRGWLTEINDVNNLSISGSPIDLFAFKINYNQVQSETGYTGKKLYNGNIAETYWRSKTDNVLRKYGYYYDNLDRVKNSIYQKPGASPVVTNSYNESIQYDKNGNITSLVRNGNTDNLNPATLIDNLAYTYDANSNQLQKVTETPASLTNGFKDGANTGNDYTYDTNGNMITDLNKGITAITYNHLNMPIKITFGTTGSIEFVYDASGTKIQKKLTQGTTVTTTDYLTGFQYKNTVLQFFPTAQGYVATSGSTYKYIYQYKDHLGNVRLTYTKNTTTGNLDIIEESHFYPFGFKHKGYNNSLLASGNTDAQKYKYNDKELQDELGLNTYDYGVRNYDPTIGRFMNIDPLAEVFNDNSSYNYAFNNPIYFIDTDGFEPTPYEAALMAQHVYGYTKIDSRFNGWHMSKNKTYNKSDVNGYKSTMYERTINGKTEYAYVYAGTNQKRDWITNIVQPFGVSGMYEMAMTDAEKVSNDFKKNEVTFVGHSLGGGLSTLSSLVTGRSSITFNPAWVSRATKFFNSDRIKHLKKDNYRINFVHEHDPLDRVQRLFRRDLLEEIGIHREIETDDFFTDPLEAHSIDTIVDAMEEEDRYDNREVFDFDRRRDDDDEREGWDYTGGRTDSCGCH